MMMIPTILGLNFSHLHDQTAKERHDAHAARAALLIDIVTDEGTGEHLTDGHDAGHGGHQLLVREQDVR